MNFVLFKNRVGEKYDFSVVFGRDCNVKDIRLLFIVYLLYLRDHLVREFEVLSIQLFIKHLIALWLEHSLKFGDVKVALNVLFSPNVNCFDILALVEKFVSIRSLFCYP